VPDVSYQDLVDDSRDSYQSVQRFVRKFKATQPQRAWRMEALPRLFAALADSLFPSLQKNSA
jgi:hypothetical protein